MAELVLHHARASECRDVEGFKAEMATLVTQARKNTITLEKLQVSSLLSNVFKLLMTHKVRPRWGCAVLWSAWRGRPAVVHRVLRGTSL